MLLLSTTLLLLFPMASVSSSEGGCESFKIMNKKGHADYGEQVPVSPKVNCTTEKAGRDGECDADHFKMGFIVNSTVNATMSGKAALLELVRDAADWNIARNVNMNRTAVIPYSVPFESVDNGTAGYFTFLPAMHCWEGILGDCKGEDQDWDGNLVMACGYKRVSTNVNDSRSIYDGVASFVEESGFDYSKSDEEKRPWPSYEEAVELVRKHTEDSDSGAMRYASVHGAFMAFIWSFLATLVCFI